MLKRTSGVVLLTILGVPLSLSAEEQITGTVRSASGEPLADVLVCPTTWMCSRTNTDGRYSLDATACTRGVIRFSRDGYKPLFRVFGKISSWSTPFEVNVVLENAAIGQARWTLPWCPDDPGERARFIGKRLRVLVPADARVVESNDVDYWMSMIGYGPQDIRQEWLKIGGGSSWSSGFPSKEDLQESTDIIDRDLFERGHSETFGPYLDGVDVRGRTKDGRYWRLTGNAFETISYRVVYKDAAIYFDRIIDTLCVSPSRR